MTLAKLKEKRKKRKTLLKIKTQRRIDVTIDVNFVSNVDFFVSKRTKRIKSTCHRVSIFRSEVIEK